LKKIIALLLACSFFLNASAQSKDDPLATLGPINNMPQLLAPGFINTGLSTRDVTMTPDGKELYFCVNTSGYRYACIMVTRFINEQWTQPEVVSFSGSPDFVDLEPALSPDGQKLFFYSTRPATPGAENSQDIWFVKRNGDGWGEPENLGAPVNTTAPEFFPSVTNDGTLYFCRADEETRLHTIFRSRLVDGKYQEPEKLPAEVNAGRSQFNAWISPDESQLIVPIAGHPDNLGGVDYWLCTRNTQDQWQGPFNLGPVVNDGSGQSWSPYVSPDGKYFFFMSSRSQNEPISWPVGWSELQDRHQHPGSGKPGIYVMKADFLTSLPSGVPETNEPDTSSIGTRTKASYKTAKGRHFGQPLPGLNPEIYAPHYISTGLAERDITFSADGKYLMFGLMDSGLVTTMVSTWQDGSWSEPFTAPWHEDQNFACFETAMSKDGKSVYFLSNQAATGQTQGRGWANQNIFTSNFNNGNWSEPIPLPAPVTTDAAEYFPSLASDGTLYFSRENEDGNPAIWMAPAIDDGFGEPVRLPAEVNVGVNNYNAFISPDQKFIIVCVGGHDDNLGESDYWVSFRNQDGTWQQAKNMGDKLNVPDSRASSAFLSPDGKVLFFSSTRLKNSDSFNGKRLTGADLWEIHTQPGMGSSDLWWVDASILYNMGQ